MAVEFIDGKCCGDCAKCELIGRPRSTEGITACAVANILPMVFCTHDLIIEQNAILSNLLKNKDSEIDELKNIVRSLSGIKTPDEPRQTETPDEEIHGYKPEDAEASPVATSKARKLTK